MAMVVEQVRSVYYRALMALLFPFVLAATLLELVPKDWRDGFAQGFWFMLAATSLMALGIMSVIGIRNLF